MKDFEDFKKYINQNGQAIHNDIVNSVNSKIESLNISDNLDEHEAYRRAWVEIGFMKLIEQYHNWLNS